MTLLTHTCSIVKSGTTTSYNQSLPSWTSGTTTTTNVACLIQPRVKRELATGAVIGTHVMFVMVANAPATLRAAGAEKSHRVTQWVANGQTDAGPFDVIEVNDAGGQGRHLEVVLRRVVG